MAIDFPASPTIGQQSNGYVYDGTKWKVSTTSTAPASVQPTPPTNPTVGDMWFNSTDGTMYFYYNDGNTSQWVESRAPIVANGYYSPNYIINGAFDINQRGVTSSGIGTNQYGLDRWRSESSTGTVTQSVQQFTPGSAPVAGIEAKQYARIVTSGQTGTGAFSAFLQKIEDVRTLANKPYTLSFYARVASGTATISADFAQGFDNGGTGDTRTPITTWTATTSWQRFSATFTPPSIAGKTIGASSVANIIMWQSSGSSIAFLSGFTAIQNNTFDYWGVQLEEGSAATQFRRNANSIEGELAACQRYYTRYSLPVGAMLGAGHCFFTSGAYVGVHYPTEMRSAPAAIDYSSLSYLTIYSGGINRVPSTIGLASNSSSTKTALLGFAGTTGFTAGYGAWVESNNAGAYVGFSAEL